MSSRTKFNLSALVIIFVILAYIAIYQWQPFDEFWNNNSLNILTILSASLTVFGCWKILSTYSKDEAQYKIWRSFTIGFGLWLSAEIAWAYLNLTLGEVPVPSLPDYLWLAGYPFFGLGFIYQYRLLFNTTPQQEQLGFWSLIIFSLIITAGIQLMNEQPFEIAAYVDLYYPVGDLITGIVALRLAWVFRRGILAWPWLALMLFGVSDALFAWLAQTDTYAYSAENGNVLSMLTDASYLAAYLILALGFMGQYFILKYGPWALSNSHPASE